MAASGSCECNPAPDSSGKWKVHKESCSTCTTSEDCASAKCWYKHDVHGEKENTGCKFVSGTVAIDPISDEVDMVELQPLVLHENGDATLQGEGQGLDASFGAAPSCFCNAPPSSTGGWVIYRESCSSCTTSGSCATAKCWYKKNSSYKEVGCRFRSGPGMKDPQNKKVGDPDKIDL